jgi:phosphatidylinositol glycan class M
MEETKKPNRFLALLADHSISIGLFLRLFLAWFLPWLLDDGRFIPGVAYTDIDYLVFTDAANYIKNGQNPYDRHTYRYTPFLAELLAHMPQPAGRYLFCIADALCGWIIIRYRQSHRTEPEPADVWKRLEDAPWWMYNPLAINICTRGSSESLMVLLPVLMTVGTLTSTKKSLLTWKHAIVAGLWHGVAVHSKLYPIIYSLSFMSYFATRNVVTTGDGQGSSFPWVEPVRLLRLIGVWASRLLTPAPLVFFVTFVATFVTLTYLAVLWYGDIALQEGLLYHFSRVDHRHNYSMYWYWIYLARAQTATNMALMGRLLLLPQLVLLVYSSLGIAPYNLGLAVFVQTFLFVTHNKVITAQYFTWYLCLLPLCSDSFSLTNRVKKALAILGISILLWLGSAYCLEMQGMAVHKIVWMASVLYFWANVNLLGALLNSHAQKKKTQSAKKSN